MSRLSHIVFTVFTVSLELVGPCVLSKQARRTHPVRLTRYLNPIYQALIKVAIDGSPMHIDDLRGVVHPSRFDMLLAKGTPHLMADNFDL